MELYLEESFTLEGVAIFKLLRNGNEISIHEDKGDTSINIGSVVNINSYNYVIVDYKRTFDNNEDMICMYSLNEVEPVMMFS